VRAVLSCDKDFQQWWRTWEVHCGVEDIGLVAMPALRTDHDQALLDELDATLTDARLQLQVSEAGGVPDVDIEGVSAHDERTRLRQETLRELVSRVALPFHLAIPDPVHDGKRWYEPHSRLLSIPTLQGSVGSITLAHYLDGLGPDYFVVQSIGKATVKPYTGFNEIIDTEGKAVDLADIFDLDMHGVALVRRADGIMSERVWVVSGGLVPSSPHNLDGLTYYHAGRLRILGPDERPGVGNTWVAARQVAGRSKDLDRPEWVSLPP
jgi:hypothetical protein